MAGINKPIVAEAQGDEQAVKETQIVAVCGLGEVDLNNLTDYQKAKFDELTSKK